jgi:protein arginine kinase
MSTARDLVERPCGWMGPQAPQGEVVLSSRIRLARNLSERTFPQRAAEPARAVLLQEILDKTQHVEALEGGLRLGLEKLQPVERQLLGERQLVSQDLVEAPQHRGVVVAKDESASFMINEEDHLRIQAIRPGLDLDQAYRVADGLDDELDARLDFAYSARFGFLTACPTNTGTGMRASVLIHLPGVVLAKESDKLLESLRKLHLTVRGFYGEGSAAMGNFFQISNAVTFGLREAEILEQLDRAAHTLIEWEQRAREALLRKARPLLEDKIWRSYGILRYARMLTSQEALTHTSLLRLGVGLKILDDVPVETLNEILVQSRPAHAQLLAAREGGASERDAWRAEMVRNKLRRAER